MITGERIFAALIGLFGLVWISQSLRLRYWGDFAPESGFLPFWLGVALVLIVAVFLAVSIRSPAAAPAEDPDAAPPAIGRVAAVVGGLLVAVALFEDLGFVVSVGAYLAFLIGVVERRPPGETAIATLGTVGAIHFIFRVWLQVPLPAGPWGF